MRQDPPVGWQWPLEARKTCTVAACEEVTVPAGASMAWGWSTATPPGRRRRSGLLDTMGAFAKGRRERSATHPQRPVTLVLEMTRQPSKP